MNIKQRENFQFYCQFQSDNMQIEIQPVIMLQENHPQSLSSLPGSEPSTRPPKFQSVFQALSPNNIQNLPTATISSSHLSDILQFTDELNSFGQGDKNMVTSSGLAMDQKRIRNFGKKRAVGSGVEHQRSRRVQEKEFASKVVLPSASHYEVQSQVPQMHAMNPMNAMHNQKGNQVFVQQQQQELTKPGTSKSFASNFYDDRESAPQFLPDDLQEAVVTQVAQPSSNPSQNIEAAHSDINRSELKIEAPSNIDLPTTRQIESAQELLYVPHNASYNFGQELKTSDVSDLSHFNAFSIATTPPGNIFSSTATLANAGTVPQTLLPALMQTTFNVQGNTQNQNQQNSNQPKASQSAIEANNQNTANTQMVVNPNAVLNNNLHQRSNLKVYGAQNNLQVPQQYPQYMLYPNLSDLNPGSFNGFPSITSTLPPGLNSVDKSKFLNQPQVLPQTQGLPQYSPGNYYYNQTQRAGQY